MRLPSSLRRGLALAGLAAAGAAFAAGHATTHAVSIAGMKFDPPTVVVHPGDTVVWTNDDLVPHTVTLAGEFDSGPIAPGKTWQLKAPARGRHEYKCSFHPTMAAVLVVQ